MSEPDRPATRQGVDGLLDAVAGMSAVLGREDLAAQLAHSREKLSSTTCHVLVVGEFGQGKSALVNALAGIASCGVSASAATSVTTVLRHGPELAAELIGRDGGRRRVPLVQAAQAALDGHDPAGHPIAGVEVRAPRELLRRGLVLVDTPGVGGGFSAARAAVTMRALSMADALVFVTDAAQELTASEVEFLQHAAQACPIAICALTKTDLFPEWRRIAGLNREHLQAAGLRLDVVPVSSSLRDLALRTGDPALWAESGYPVLSRMLSHRVPARRRAADRRGAVRTAGAVLGSLGDQLETEQLTLDDPDGHAARLAGLEQAQEHAERIRGAGARWQHLLADQVRAASRAATDDLDQRLAGVRRAAGGRIAEVDPATAWPDIEPWLTGLANDELVAHHRHVLRQVARMVTAVAAEFDLAAADLPTGSWLSGAGALPITPAVEELSIKPASLLDVSMNAARGFSLSSSVVSAVLFTVIAPLATPALLLSVPVVAGLGAVFAYRSVRSGKDLQLRQARAEAVRLAGGYLDGLRVSTWRADEDMIDTVRRALRDHFAQQAAHLVADAAANVRAAEEASRLDTVQARVRQSLVGTRAAAVRRLAHGVGSALESTAGGVR
jgi:Dynamin family